MTPHASPPQLVDTGASRYDPSFVRPYDHETCFPWRLAEEVVAILKARGAAFVTHADIAADYGAVFMTPDDLQREYQGHLAALGVPRPLRGARGAKLWRLVLRAGLARRLDALAPRARALTVILQHDADRQPYKTVEMMRRERAMGVRSANYFFVERHVWDDDREPYDYDLAEAQALERDGFEIGYHLNAYELAGHDKALALEIAARDFEWLRARFNVRTFVPHGGVPGPDGLNNDTFIEPHEAPSCVWAYNRYGLVTDMMWSDGALYDSAPADPRVLARRAPRGARIRFLMHPQYYGRELAPLWLDRPIARERWWRDLWGLA